MMKQAYDLHTVHNTIYQEKKDNVYQLHSNNIYQLYNRGIPEPCQPECVIVSLFRYPLHTFYHLHITLRYGQGVGFMGGFHHHHHISVMELGHLLTRSGLTCPEVSSKVCHDSFCQLGNSVSLPWVIYCEAFYLHVVGYIYIYEPQGHTIISWQ